MQVVIFQTSCVYLDENVDKNNCKKDPGATAVSGICCWADKHPEAKNAMQCCKGKNNTSCRLKIYGDILGKQPPLERDGTLVWRSCFYRCCCCREKQPLFSRPLHSLGRITTIGNRGIRGSAIWNGERRAQLHSARQRDWYSIKPRAELAK